MGDLRAQSPCKILSPHANGAEAACAGAFQVVGIRQGCRGRDGRHSSRHKTVSGRDPKYLLPWAKWAEEGGNQEELHSAALRVHWVRTEKMSLQKSRQQQESRDS